MSGGGTANPIVEFGDDEESSFALIARFMPDAIFHVNEKLSKSAFDARFPELMTRTIALKLLDEESPGLVSIETVCRHYFEKLFRFDRGESRVTSVDWSEDHPGRALLSAMFGDLKGSRSDRFRRAFESISNRSCLVTDEVDPELTELVYPARLTTDSLRIVPFHVPDHGVVVGSSSDISDLVDFWNIRATGSSATFFPVDQPELLRSYVARFIEQLAESRATKDLSIWNFDRNEEATEWLKHEAKQLELAPLLARSKEPRYRFAPAPATWRTDSASVLASVETKENGVSEIAATLPERPFTAGDDPVNAWSTHWIVDIYTFGEHELSDSVLRLPSIMALDPWASDRVSVIGDVRLRSGHLGIIVNRSESHATFRAVPIDALAKQLFAIAGISAETSAAGQATKRIVAQMNGLYGTRPLRLPGVRKLFQRTGSNYNWNAALSTIHDGGSFSEYKNVGTARQVFEQLLERGALQARLKIPCPSCTITSHYPPDALGSSIKCERCDSSFHLSTQIHKSTWCYRPSGFFANHQEHGAIPVILAMMRLEMDCRDAILAPSMNLSARSMRCETDLVLIDRSRDGNVLVAVGECKGGNEEINPTDIENLKRVNEMLQGAGLSTALIFATTRPSFSNDERNQLKSLRDDVIDVPIVLLSGFELESLYTYRALGGREGMPARYVHSLRDLAQNSEFLHIEGGKLPEADEELTKLYI